MLDAPHLDRITTDDALRLVFLNDSGELFLPPDLAPSLKACLGEDGYAVYAECCELCGWNVDEAHTRAQWESIGPTEPQRIAEWLAYYDTDQDEREAAFKARHEEILAKKCGRTAAEIFFIGHGREPASEELSGRYRPAPYSAEEHLADFEKWNAEFLESREYIRTQHPHVIDELDQEAREWLSDFDPASEFHLPDKDRWPNVVRCASVIESAEWLCECAAMKERVAAVAGALEVEVKRRILGI